MEWCRKIPKPKVNVPDNGPDTEAMQSQLKIQGQLLELLASEIEELKLVINTLSSLEDLGQLPAPLDMDDSPMVANDLSGNDWGDPAEYGNGDQQHQARFDDYHDARDQIRKYGSINGDRGLGDEFSLEFVDSDGDEQSINWQANEPGDYLEYCHGLNQVQAEPGSRWHTLCCAWLSREANKRGDTRKAINYGLRARAGGASLNEVHYA